MTRNIKKVSLFILLAFILLAPLGYLGKGALEYSDWIKTKQAISAGGFTNLYAGTLGTVTPGCTYTTKGCTCDFCNTCGCNTYDQALITQGQQVNKGAQYLCVSNKLKVKGTPLLTSSGKQFMVGSLTGQCLTGNAVMATPSMAATNFEKLANLIDTYIIAGFKED